MFSNLWTGYVNATSLTQRWILKNVDEWYVVLLHQKHIAKHNHTTILAWNSTLLITTYISINYLTQTFGYYFVLHCLNVIRKRKHVSNCLEIRVLIVVNLTYFDLKPYIAVVLLGVLLKSTVISAVWWYRIGKRFPLHYFIKKKIKGKKKKYYEAFRKRK